MVTRIITGIVLIAAVIAWLFFADFPIFTMGALFIYMVGAYELGPIFKFKQRYLFLFLAVAAAVCCFVIAPPGEFVSGHITPVVKYIIALSIPLWIGVVPLIKAYPHKSSWYENKVICAILGLLMLVPFLEGLLVLRATDIALDANTGAYLVLAVMALVWAADSGAYFAGVFFGKNKLIPAVSPKKTREGLYGGLILAFAALILFMHLGLFSVYADSSPALIASGIIAIVFSVIGDLLESMIKRLGGVKDSGKIFPGHGGMLDRIDSQLAAVPLFLSVNWLISGNLA